MANTTAAIFATLSLASIALAACASDADAASERVRHACQGDYLAYCSQHPEEGPAVRKCMDAHGAELTKDCVEALIAEGEVSRAEVERRRTAAARR